MGDPWPHDELQRRAQFLPNRQPRDTQQHPPNPTKLTQPEPKLTELGYLLAPRPKEGYESSTRTHKGDHRETAKPQPTNGQFPQPLTMYVARNGGAKQQNRTEPNQADPIQPKQKETEMGDTWPHDGSNRAPKPTAITDTSESSQPNNAHTA